MVAHRKQGPVLPTLVINIAPDAALDKLRKRRSSRAAGLVSTGKETTTNTLWFRIGADEREGGHTIHDWAKCIQTSIQPKQDTTGPLSPLSPVSPSFGNPFGARQHRDASEYYQPRPPSASARATLQHKASAQTAQTAQTSSTRERPATFSDSPSLRSRRSDNSSISGTMNPSHAGFQGFNTKQPTDLPPLATGEYSGSFIEGWTTAKGRSSTLSSPIRARDSLTSIPPGPFSPPPQSESDNRPAPRETILDRAFQLHYIPGSEQGVPGEEKLTSLARFDALMRNADEQRKLREQREQASMRPPPPPPLTTQLDGGLKSAWELDDDSDDDLVEADFDDQDDDDADVKVAREEDMEEEDVIMPPDAQKALNFISGRLTPHTSPRGNAGPRSPISYNPETLMALSGPSTRPQTAAHDRRRPTYGQRSQSQSYITGHSSFGMEAVSPISKMTSVIEDGGINAVSGLQRSSTEKQQSTSSTKRLSFTEFTRRLSSTSSLMLVPTNHSNASSFHSEPDVQPQQQMSTRLSVQAQARGHSPLPQNTDRDRELQDKKCGWRGSVGVFGGEGGFL